jgi:DNA-binding response OmpR family regulator
MCSVPASSHARILLLSGELSLAESRKAIIELQPGWLVTVSRNKQHALALLHKESFNLLILCNSLTPAAQEEFAAIFRQKNASAKILVLAVRGTADLRVDAVLSAPVTPADLISAVHTLLAAGTRS